MFKRLKEIEARKLEIRNLLTAGGEADLDALEKELKDLEAEEKELNKRKALIEGINTGAVPASSIPNPAAQDNREDREQISEAEYRSAWLKQIRRIELNDAEKRAVITTGAGSAGAAVPTSTMNKIISKVNQYCPLLDKIDLLHVPGGVTIPAEGTTADAALHSEGATITADGDTLSSVTLGAFEITKLITISKSVEKMSVDAFETWLVNKLARKIADKITALIISGTGSNQPQGINAISWTSSNSVTVAVSADLTAANVKAVVGKLNGGYDAGAEWLMSKSTFMNDFHPLMDNSKNNVVTLDGGKYYVMGYPVNWDDRVTAHEAFLGNFYRGYVGNMPEEVNVTSQFVTRENAYDFLGAAMFDGKVQAVEAFVKIVKATS